MNEADIARAFIRGVVTDRVREVYDQYTHAHFVHHNPWFKGNREALLEGMVEDNVVHPDKKLTIMKVITELPYITVLAHVQMTATMEMAIVHIYRFEQKKIAEAWDIAQEIPAERINEHGMF